MRIISENCSSSGSSSGNVLPTPPTNLSLSLNGSNEPTGAFTLSTDPTVTSHRVYRRPIATTNWTLIATVSTGVFTDTNVPADGDWQYKVVSVNSIGESIEETSSQMQSINVVTASTLSAPTNIEVTQADPSSNNIVTFDDSQTNATTLIIFREVVLSGVPANQTRQQVASVNPADGINSWEDTYLEQGKEYIYDVQSSDGTNTTNVFNYGDNAVSYTSLQPIATVTGIVFDEANDEYLLRNATDALSAPWSIKMTFQEMSHTSGTVGMFGTDSSATYRFIAYPGSNYMRMNVPPSLQTSGTFTNAIDFVSRNEREVYCEAAGDVYYKASPTATPQFLFNIDDGSSVPNFLLNTLIRAGGGGSVLRASATLINFTIDNNGLIETFACNEGSGDTITGSNGTVWTIQTTGDINHINNNMWNTAVSQPPGFAEVTSLSVGGRSTQLLLDNLLDNPANHTPGTVTYEIARIYDNYSGSSNHNPAGYDTFFIGTMTNDIGNIGSFLTPSEYATALTSVLQIFNGTYSGPNAASLPMSNVRAVVGTVGTFDTAVKQSQKNYDTTIGAMLSGDPLNPTPESAWDFNTDETGLIAVSPLYVVQAISVTTNLGNSFANVFQAFIDGQTSPTYHDWIGLDGTHYTGDGYNNYGIAAAVPINGLVPEASKVCVLMDSLGDGVAETLQSALNAS